MARDDPEIENFISDSLLLDEEKGEIITSLRELVLGAFPQSEEKIKYGGLVFIVDNRLFCGVFPRKDHVSMEFDNGALMSDPHGLLEGGGKHRRHLKLSRLEDIEDKKAGYYLRQSFLD
ncbi:MAG: DUF1801 domain-containing protein [Actinobacteria bacterium]|nr:DUF1801 domain-containing protein [Actinomycetota bacterium]